MQTNIYMSYTYITSKNDLSMPCHKSSKTQPVHIIYTLTHSISTSFYYIKSALLYNNYKYSDNTYNNYSDNTYNNYTIINI